jgi:hypothetical protein
MTVDTFDSQVGRIFFGTRGVSPILNASAFVGVSPILNASALVGGALAAMCAAHTLGGVVCVYTYTGIAVGSIEKTAGGGWEAQRAWLPPVR